MWILSADEWWGAGVVICLGSGQICVWPSRCHYHSVSLAPVNPDWFYLLAVGKKYIKLMYAGEAM